MLKLPLRARTCQFRSVCSARFEQARTFHASISARTQSKPISLDEFKELYERCSPTRPQEDKIAVAFSGGPDSTCLLYLLKQLSDNNAIGGREPSRIVAITVDHDLQAASSEMTKKCVLIAKTLQVKHLVLKIPWGINPFPPVPSKGSSFENIAREARYHLFLSALKEGDISTIAFGHHVDDQVETALLRITRGSTEAGVAGMQPRRLWGMGFGLGPEDLGWAGHHGMSRWIIRPLLRLPKERLVATCRAAGLDYVVDKTNLQPNIALRNRIRCHLGDASSAALPQGTKALLDMAAGVVVSGDRIKRRPDSHQEDRSSSQAQLRSAVESISNFVGGLNHEASIQLPKCLRPSPASTILLSKDDLSRVTDNSVRLEIIRRVLRFVSPFPWGSPRAEAGRRKASLQRISDTLTASGEWSGKDSQGKDPQRKFVAGGGVIWSPVHITRNAEMKFSEKGCSVSDERGWLASRQPPIQRFRDFPTNSPELDITTSVLSALSQNTSVEILFDCRFLLHITPRLFPPDVLDALRQITAGSGGISVDQALAKLLVVPYTRFFLPKIILRRTDTQAELLSSGDAHRKWQGQTDLRENEQEIARLLPDGSTRTQSSTGENNKSGLYPACSGEAVRVKYTRILDSFTTSEYLGQHSM